MRVYIILRYTGGSPTCIARAGEGIYYFTRHRGVTYLHSEGGGGASAGQSCREDRGEGGGAVALGSGVHRDDGTGGGAAERRVGGVGGARGLGGLREGWEGWFELGAGRG